MLTGAITISTSSSGQRIRPIAKAVASTTNGAGPKLRNIGAAIFAAVAMSRPAAAGAMPLSTRRTASTSP